jgi:hypothetical protein
MRPHSRAGTQRDRLRRDRTAIAPPTPHPSCRDPAPTRTADDDSPGATWRPSHDLGSSSVPAGQPGPRVPFPVLAEPNEKPGRRSRTAWWVPDVRDWGTVDQRAGGCGRCCSWRQKQVRRRAAAFVIRSGAADGSLCRGSAALGRQPRLRRRYWATGSVRARNARVSSQARAAGSRWWNIGLSQLSKA